MGPIIYVLLQVTFLVFGKFFEKEEMQKNIKTSWDFFELAEMKTARVSRVWKKQKTSKARMRKWVESWGFFIWDKLYNISQWIS